MAATSQLLGDLAFWLASKGWDVTAIAGRAEYAIAREASVNGSVHVWRGVSVRRPWCTNFGRGTVAGRLCDYLTFLLSASSTLAFASRPDVVICLSTPPFVALLGLIAKMKRSRLVYKVEDLYPEIAVALSRLKSNSVLTSFLSRLSRFVLNKADHVVALDAVMMDRLQAAGARSVTIIPNWADGEAIWPDPQLGEIFRRKHHLEGRFIVLYSGNLGLAHRFDSIVETAKRCAVDLPESLFLFVGRGARLQEVRVAVRGLRNVRFMDYLPREKLNELYNAADLHLVTVRDEVSGLLFPSKYPAALAAGKPVLLVGGRGALFEDEIREKLVGWTCSHEPSAVFAAVQNGFENPHKREAMGRNARRLFEARYSKTIALERWEELVSRVANVHGLEPRRFQYGEQTILERKGAISRRWL